MPHETSSTKIFAFDAYGTLFDFNTVHRCADQLGERAGALRELWRSKQLQYFWERNMLGQYRPYEEITADALDVAMRILKIDSPGLKRRLLDLYGDLEAYPEVKAALETLKQQSCRLVIHTNATARLAAASVDSCGLGGLFDDIISIDDIGIYKPDPAAYRYLIHRTRASPEKIRFISSNGWDTHGAAHFGLKVIWVNRHSMPDDALPGKPYREVPNLRDIALVQ